MVFVKYVPATKIAAVQMSAEGNLQHLSLMLSGWQSPDSRLIDGSPAGKRFHIPSLFPSQLPTILTNGFLLSLSSLA
ncbi:hypothetical protein PSTT_00254 [Puccinia striiformis]|uniref:Uncharacterized protein n=1 Tax=Puccinia striiformis TaxID=27350 RepID=A0A2S4W8C9_9BASI|nr:hypothetical protein PSTT_00254 [Puccinia striiformis]